MSVERERQMRINNVLYAIHRQLDGALTVDDLAAQANYSSYHFQRVFKQLTGETVHQYIRKARLEQAANLLLFNHDLSVLDIVHRCGFHSQPSFTHAFKAQFNQSPKQWRKQAWSRKVTDGYLLDDPIVAAAWQNILDLPLPKITVQQRDLISVAYVRHQGYGLSICESWRYLQQWCEQQQIPLLPEQMFGLHHSSPVFVPYSQCRYVACVATSQPVFRQGRVAALDIPAGSYACFNWQGRYGDLLPILMRIYKEWLPTSGYRLAMLPGYACYRRNPFLDDEHRFDLTFHIPITVA